jgi:hypothetical protein
MNGLHDKNLADLLTDVKTIIGNSNDLNHEKDNLNEMLTKVNFLIGRYDQLYAPFIELFESMAQLDFTKRVPPEANNEFFEFMATGINMVNEELEGVVIHKDVLSSVLEGLDIQGGTVIITDHKGFISYVKSNAPDLHNFNESTLKGQRVPVVFKSFDAIDEKIKQLNSIKDYDVELQWMGKVIPKKLTLAMAVKLGKINSMVYVLKDK